MPDHKNTILTKFYVDGTEVRGIDLDSVLVPDGEFVTKNVSSTKNPFVQKNTLRMYEPGSCEFSCLSIPGDQGQNMLETAFRNRTECTFQVVLTESGITYEYTGKITKYLPDSESNTAKNTVKILSTGLFSRNVTYAGVTKIEATAGTVTPTTETVLSDSGNVCIVIEPPGNLTDSIKITAPDADSIEYSLDNGVNWDSLISGVTSGDIPLSSTGAITKALVKIEEGNTASRFVLIYITNSV